MTAATRTILHVDMDAFFAAVEQHDNPALRGRPVVVGAPPDRRGVVSAASYEARTFGIHSAMPSREAYRRCPHAVFVPVNGRRYGEVSRQVFGILERYTPLVEPLSIDEAFLDVTGSRRLFGDGPAIGERIRADIRAGTGLTASVGVATNKFLAKVASDMHKPDGLTVVPAEPAAIRAFLAPLPVGRLWGVGKVTGALLHRAGIMRVADVQQAEPARLAALLGPRIAADLQRLAAGLDERTVETESEAKSISREHTFDEDCRDAGVVEDRLSQLIEDVGGRLRAAGVYGSTGVLKLRWSDFTTLTRQESISPPCCDDMTLRETALRLLRREWCGRAVRLVGFGVTGLVAGYRHQLSLFEDPTRQRQRRERLSHTVDDIRRRFGRNAIGMPRIARGPDEAA